MLFFFNLTTFCEFFIAVLIFENNSSSYFNDFIILTIDLSSCLKDIFETFSFFCYNSLAILVLKPLKLNK